jgi:hypothetical protein
MRKRLNSDSFDLLVDCDFDSQGNPVIPRITVQTIEKVIADE